MEKNQRKKLVESFTIDGKSSYEIAKLLNYGVRTIERDKQELKIDGKLKTAKAEVKIKEPTSNEINKETYRQVKPEVNYSYSIGSSNEFDQSQPHQYIN